MSSTVAAFTMLAAFVVAVAIEWVWQAIEDRRRGR